MSLCIDLNKILIDHVITKTIMEIDPTINLSVFKHDKNHNIVGKTLERLKPFSEYNEDIPPVKLRKHQVYVAPHKRKMDDGIYYVIIDGRHRVSNAILANKKNIKAIII